MRSDELYLGDIIIAIDSIVSFLDQTGKQDFLANDLLQSAVQQKFMIIGEASSKVSGELRIRYPSLDWTGMIAFRNVLIHHYFGVDLEIIWATAANRLIPLRAQVEVILEEYSSYLEASDD